MYLIKLLLWEILGGVGRGGGRVLQDSWNNLVIFSFHLVHYVQRNGHIQSWVSRRERTSIRSSVFKHKLSLPVIRYKSYLDDFGMSGIHPTKHERSSDGCESTRERYQKRKQMQHWEPKLAIIKEEWKFRFSLPVPRISSSAAPPPPLLPRLTQNNANTRNRIMLQQIFPRKYPSVGNQCKSIYMYSYLEIKNQVRLHTWCSCWIYILMLFAIMKLICLGFPVNGFLKK